MYHGCAMGFRDGTRIPIRCGLRNKMAFEEKCVLATDLFANMQTIFRTK